VKKVVGITREEVQMERNNTPRNIKETRCKVFGEKVQGASYANLSTTKNDFG
jgi:hypothetical protein